tara:strand:+ start:111 stop:341 length:231 start_codon:yes stop_codon:yes gene_type:complete
MSFGLIIGRLLGVLSASIFLKFKFNKTFVLDSIGNLKCFLKKCRNFPIYGDGKNIRDWLHVFDRCTGIDLVYHKGR